MADDQKPAKKISAKDVAASTAVGAASRLGAARLSQNQGERLTGDAAAIGAGAGAAAGKVKKKIARGGSNVGAALLVVGVLIGMLTLMMWLNSR